MHYRQCSSAYIMCLAWCLLIQQHCTIGSAAVLTSRSTIVICIIFELLFSFIAATNIVTTNWNSINIFISQYLYCKLNLPEHRAIIRGGREAMLRHIFAIKQVYSKFKQFPLVKLDYSLLKKILPPHFQNTKEHLQYSEKWSENLKWFKIEKKSLIFIFHYCFKNTI